MKGQILLNLLFWIPNSFCTFHDCARGVIASLPPLTALTVTDFLSLRFLNNFLALKNIVALKLFTILKYFLSFRTFEQLVACPEKQSMP